MLKRIVAVLLVGIAALFAYAATRPDTFSIERSTAIAAPPTVVFEQIADYEKWNAWSPWEKIDPEMKRSYSGPPGAVGSSYSWVGDSSVGEGSLTITASQPPLELAHRLEFVEPMESSSDVSFSLSPQGDGSVIVTWSMQGTNNLMSKFLGLFVNTDEMIGSQFERGLADLKTVSERQIGR